MLEGVEAEEGAAEVEERQVNVGAADPASACRHGAAAATAARSHRPTDSQNVADSDTERRCFLSHYPKMRMGFANLIPIRILRLAGCLSAGAKREERQEYQKGTFVGRL